MMLDIDRFSSKYRVRIMNDDDAEEIMRLCAANTQFYEYSSSSPDKDSIISDLHITPPGKDISSKYYVGFYDEDVLVAVMDLIDGYPEEDVCFIGFFMMNRAFQGRNIGTSIISGLCRYLNDEGYGRLQLAIDKGNPQSNNFWKKNGFVTIREIRKEDWTIVYSERVL